MGKSLNELINGLEEADSHTPLYKHVKCSCGNEMPVWGGTNDVVCPNHSVIEEVNNATLTSANYHMQRSNTRIRKKVDAVIDAEHYQDSYEKRVEDKT